MKTSLLSTVFLLVISIVSAQQKDYQDDVKSVDAIVSALYTVISGESGQAGVS